MPIETQAAALSGGIPTPVDTLKIRGDRLRILHVVARLGMGGTEHGMMKVLDGLSEEQFEHRICAVRGIDAKFGALANVAVPVYSAGSPEPGFQFPLFRLVRIMKEFCPHIVHSRNFGAMEAIPAAHLARVPVTIHSEHGYELEILSGLPLRRRVLSRAFCAMADAIFAVTEDLRSYHCKQSWIPSEKCRVIYNGVNTERFSPRPDVAGVRKELHIPQERIVIGTVGRLVPIKDHRTLLQAAENLLRQRKNVHVLLVGAGPDYLNLQRYAADSSELAGHVTFAGSSDRIPEMLNAMDVYVLPSICEGMSNTILEAMASGLPVVATRSGGNTELVEDGRTGWLFTPRDVQALAQHLARLVDAPDLRQRIGDAARRQVIEKFSLAAMVESYRDLYVGLATRSGAWRGN